MAPFAFGVSIIKEPHLENSNLSSNPNATRAAMSLQGAQVSYDRLQSNLLHVFAIPCTLKACTN